VLNLAGILRRHRAGSRGYAELVPWMILLTPGLVLDKDGALLALFDFGGIDVEGLPPEGVDRQVRLLERAMRDFDERVALWWIVDRRRAPASAASTFAHPVSACIDRLWAEALRRDPQFTNRHVLALAWTPDRPLSVRWALSRRQAFAREAAAQQLDCQQFEEVLHAFAETAADLSLERLHGPRLLAALHDRVSPASEGQPVLDAGECALLDAWLPDNELTVHADRLVFEHLQSVQLAALSVKAWPGSTWPGALDTLLEVPGELSLVVAFRFEHPARAARRIRDIQRHQRNLQKSFAGYLKEAITREPTALVDEGRLQLAEDASAALAHLTAGGGAFGHCSIVLLARGRDPAELDETLREAAGRLRRVGFPVIRERMNLLAAFSVSIPGQWALSPRWFFVSGANLADLAPVRSCPAGSPVNAHLSRQCGRTLPALALLPTDARTPFHFDLHVGDVGHALVIGPSGSGKSVLMNFLVAQGRKYPGSRVFIFDKDHSCRIPTLLQGGTHLDAGSGATPLRINPLERLDEPAERAWLARWLELLLTARGHAMRSEDDRALREALELLAAQPRAAWRLRSLVPLLPGRLADELHDWVGNGLLARYFDHDGDGWPASSCPARGGSEEAAGAAVPGEFTCIEIGGLFSAPRVAGAFLDHAFRRVERSLDGSPALVYVEEAWFMLAEPLFCRRLNDWLRTLRKRNASVVLATQSLEEIEASPLFASVVDNIPTRIYLANPNALAHARLYRERFGLNAVQLERIRQACPKRDYYVTRPGRSRMASIVFPPRLLAALRSDPRAQAVFDRHRDSGADGWERCYLDELSGTVEAAAAEAVR
jgi:type IV secretion/conjugal transfer VirB4 family ATPase